MAITTRREALKLGAAMGLGTVLATPAFAQQQFFRIGTGGTGRHLLSSRRHDRQRHLQPTRSTSPRVATNGSVANVNGIVGGAMESGFSQADVASWAHKGTGIYEGKPNVTSCG